MSSPLKPPRRVNSTPSRRLHCNPGLHLASVASSLAPSYEQATDRLVLELLHPAQPSTLTKPPAVVATDPPKLQDFTSTRRLVSAAVAASTIVDKLRHRGLSSRRPVSASGFPPTTVSESPSTSRHASARWPPPLLRVVVAPSAPLPTSASSTDRPSFEPPCGCASKPHRSLGSCLGARPGVTRPPLGSALSCHRRSHQAAPAASRQLTFVSEPSRQAVDSPWLTLPPASGVLKPPAKPPSLHSTIVDVPRHRLFLGPLLLVLSIVVPRAKLPHLCNEPPSWPASFMPRAISKPPP